MPRPSSVNPTKKYRGFTWLGRLSMKQRGVIAAFVAIFAGIGGYILLSGSFAAPAAPSVYLTPATKTLGANSTFTVEVRENSGTTAVNAVQANLTYQTNLLQFVSIDGSTSAFTTEANATGGSGSISIARGIIGTLTGDQLVATITFKTLTTTGNASLPFTSGTALIESTNNTDILGSLSATAGGMYTVDNTAPSVSVTAPAGGASLASGSTVNVTASASDTDSSVSSVDFYIDSIKVASRTTAPYSYSWPTTGVALGAHTIQAKATDAFGNVGSSAVVNVTVTDQTAPSVSITSPSNNASISGTVSIAASASDNSSGSGVNKVEFYVDGVLKGTDSTTPYSYSWDSKTVSDGTHSLTAKAYDNASPANITTSTAISVKVDNTAPTEPGNFHASSKTQTSITLAWDASTDANSVTGYRLQRSGTTITTTNGSTLSYNNSGLTAGTSYTYTIVALDARGNTSTAATLTVSTDTKAGDVNGDNTVNITDLSILLSHWNTTDATSDLNRDGTVNIVDLSILLSHWGQ